MHREGDRLQRVGERGAQVRRVDQCPEGVWVAGAWRDAEGAGYVGHGLDVVAGGEREGDVAVGCDGGGRGEAGDDGGDGEGGEEEGEGGGETHF